MASNNLPMVECLITTFLLIFLHLSPLAVGQPQVAKPAAAVGEFNGAWRIDSPNCGVSAMHMQLMPNNKMVWFDSTSNGLSEIKNDPPFCKGRIGGRLNDPMLDCTAHGIAYDVETAQIRTLRVGSSPWCSSGALSKNGDLISTGGFLDGYRALRVLEPCDTCDFKENARGLFSHRWYATNHGLENGDQVMIGGRYAYNYEIIDTNSPLNYSLNLRELPLLLETDDDGMRENNLYPFVNLLPDGNLFVFANYKSIILEPYSGQTIRKLPDFIDAHNYPASGTSALLPIDLNLEEPNIEVIICGGNTREAYLLSDLQQPKRTFLPAFKQCGRLNLNKPEKWEMEDMPSPRVMSDMLILPTGDLLLINGAKAGTSAWNAAAEPNFTPVLYSPYKPAGTRFRELTPSTIPRMYHSCSAVLPSAEIIVTGSNTNAFYMLPKYNDRFIYQTELRVEKFTPPYLDPKNLQLRVNINDKGPIQVKYGQGFEITLNTAVPQADLRVTLYSPPFTTHGYSMNQRLVILKIKGVEGTKIQLEAPPNGRIAPPGFYMLFVVRSGVPSRAVWIQMGK